VSDSTPGSPSIKTGSLYDQFAETSLLSKKKFEPSGSQDVLAKIYENTLIRKDLPSATSLGNSKLTFITNPIPFYAGWDESLRKFVVTNRLLSKTKAGYEMNFKNYKLININKIFEILINMD
jgi:hypothetical protein